MTIGFKRPLSLGGLAVAVFVGAPAVAVPVIVEAPTADAVASAIVSQGPNSAQAAVEIKNGSIVSSTTGPGGAVSTSTVSANAPNVSASASIDGYDLSLNPLQSRADAAASLSLGRVQAAVGATGPNSFGNPFGIAQGRIADTVYFTNSTGSATALNLSYSYDGFMADSNGGGSLSGSAGLRLENCNVCSNALGQSITFAGDGSDANLNLVGQFNLLGTYNVQNALGTAGLDWTFTPGSKDGAAGGVAGVFSTTLIIPTGTTTLGIYADLLLDCRGGSQCDFSHTGQFGFGPLADGLTFTSASGNFLTGAGQPPSSVPEPASLALMTVGFAMVGVARRRAVRAR